MFLLLLYFQFIAFSLFSIQVLVPVLSMNNIQN